MSTRLTKRTDSRSNRTWGTTEELDGPGIRDDWREALLELSEETRALRGNVPNYTHHWDLYA